MTRKFSPTCRIGIYLPPLFFRLPTGLLAQPLYEKRDVYTSTYIHAYEKFGVSLQGVSIGKNGPTVRKPDNTPHKARPSRRRVNMYYIHTTIAIYYYTSAHPFELGNRIRRRDYIRLRQRDIRKGRASGRKSSSDDAGIRAYIYTKRACTCEGTV